MPDRIEHHETAHRFTLATSAGIAVLTYREVDTATLDFDHTFVPPALRGGGIASRLTGRALDYARARGAKVIPSCPFVAVYIERHPEYRDLLP
jgi:predicted GNAT family acetyltransferase